MKEIVINLIGSVIDLCFGTVGLNSSDLQISDAMFHLIDKVWDYFAIVGIGMTLIYFLLEINQKLAFERSDFSLHSFGAPFLKLVFAIAILANGAEIISYVLRLGNVLIAKTFIWDLGSVDTTNHLFDTLEDAFGSMGFFAALVMILPCMAMYIVAAVCSLAWKYKAITYKIEVLYRVGISPVALADVYSGQNAQAIRWVKSMLGMMLYGASFILVIKLGNTLAVEQVISDLQSWIDSNSGESIWSMITHLIVMPLVPIAEISVISAVRSAIKEALA